MARTKETSSLRAVRTHTVCKLAASCTAPRGRTPDVISRFKLRGLHCGRLVATRPSRLLTLVIFTFYLHFLPLSPRTGRVARYQIPQRNFRIDQAPLPLEMSKTEAPLPEEFDFWEFVCCGLCHLPFSTDLGGPPPAPFWITECGHVVCNSHLS